VKIVFVSFQVDKAEHVGGYERRVKIARIQSSLIVPGNLIKKKRGVVANSSYRFIRLKAIDS